MTSRKRSIMSQVIMKNRKRSKRGRTLQRIVKFILGAIVTVLV